MPLQYPQFTNVPAATGMFTGAAAAPTLATTAAPALVETAKSGLFGFDPASIAFALFANSLLNKKPLLTETPMTPEEAAMFAGQQRLETALGGVGEGAGEFLLDAIEQARAANVTPEQIAETLNSSTNPTAGLINLTVGSNQPFVDVPTAAEAALSNVSAEGGFSEAEANEVYDLIKNGTVTPAEVSSVFNVPEGIINAALETIDAERATAAATDTLGGSTSSLESDKDLEGDLDTIFDSTASAASTAGSGATVVNTDAEHPWLYEGNGVLRNVFTGEVETNESGTENLVVGETYSSGTPTEATTRSEDTTDSGNINITLTPSVGGGTTSTVTNTTTTGSADTAVVDGGGGLDTGNVTLTNGNGGGQDFYTATDSNNTGETLTVGDTTVTNGTNGVDGTDGTNGVDGADGTNGVDGADGRDGRDGRDGLTGLLTLNSIATPIADEIFTSEFKMDYLKPEFIGLLDLTRGRTV